MIHKKYTFFNGQALAVYLKMFKIFLSVILILKGEFQVQHKLGSNEHGISK